MKNIQLTAVEAAALACGMLYDIISANEDEDTENIAKAFALRDVVQKLPLLNNENGTFFIFLDKERSLIVIDHLIYVNEPGGAYYTDVIVPLIEKLRVSA